MITGQKIISLLKKMLQSPVLRSAAPYLGFFLMTAFFLCIFARIGGQSHLGPEPGSSGSSPPLTEAAESNLENDYFLNVLLLTPEGQNIQSAAQHLQQALLPNVEIEMKTLNEMPELTPGSYDFIYLEVGLSNDQLFAAAKERLSAYVQAGGVLFLTQEYIDHFPREFLGISRVERIKSPQMNFSYPSVRGNLAGLQEVWRSFAELYGHYEGLEPAYYTACDLRAAAGTAVPLVEQEGLACLLAHDLGEGLVLWSNGFLPGEYFVTRFDFVPTGEQPYFHFGSASANYLFRQELLNLVSKEKYGFSLKKSYGPYGRPGLAWQNHYEEISSFPSRDMIKWIDLLAAHDQIPTFSLIRGSFQWGQWQSSLSIHLNEGTDNEPVFRGTTDNCFYSAGERLAGADNYLLFSTYPLYKTLLSEIEQPCRPYPQLVDWNGSGQKDLLVGTAEGTLHLLKNTGTAERPRFQAAQPLTTAAGSILAVESHAAPLVYDYNGNGLLDLLVGDGAGRITLFLNTGSAAQPRFAPAGFLQAGGKVLKTAGAAAPLIVDWDGDGQPDLLVGESSGKVIFFPGSPVNGKLNFKAGQPLRHAAGEVQVNSFAAPLAVDWNNNGRLDLLVGSGKGEINLYLRQETGELLDTGSITARSPNFFGSSTLKLGHNAVPLVLDWNNDGKKDLLTGQLEYGIPCPIDSPFFPYPRELRENLRYARERQIPIIPHLFLHEFLSTEQEIREIALHKKAFQAVGLPWEDDTGANHHTWRISRDNPLGTFHNLKQAGIWWDFGFSPPGRVGAPRDGKNFLMAIPFTLPGTDAGAPFLLFSPAPNLQNFPYAWDVLARYDLPATYFEHIEHCLDPGGTIYPGLLQKIELLNEFKDQHEYNFMTEEQMARALLNTFFAGVGVEIVDGNRLRLTPDYSLVPPLAKEYRGTLGLKIELGEALQGKELTTSGLFFHQAAAGEYYLGLEQPQDVYFGTQSGRPEKWHIIRSNGPVEIEATGDNTFTLTLKAHGLQEIKFFAPAPLKISGKDLKIANEGSYYTVTHFGAPVTIKLTPEK
jgi:hypothetical protein